MIASIKPLALNFMKASPSSCISCALLMIITPHLLWVVTPYQFRPEPTAENLELFKIWCVVVIGILTFYLAIQRVMTGSLSEHPEGECESCRKDSNWHHKMATLYILAFASVVLAAFGAVSQFEYYLPGGLFNSSPQ